MAYIDPNAANAQRLRRNAQRTKKANFAANIVFTTTDRLLGRDTAGGGAAEEIAVTGGIEFSGSGSIRTSAFTGDATKTAGGTVLTLATVNANVGTFNNVTVNGKGLVTAATNVAYLTANQTITLSGDASGSGTTAITVTLATVNSNVGTFNTVTVNGKGLVTAATNTAYLTATNFVYGETPSGTVNGINDTFTLANTPTAGTVALYVNGLRMKSGSGNDYTISGSTITFEAGAIPLTGDVLQADYQK